VPTNVRQKINTIKSLCGDGKIVQFVFAKCFKKNIATTNEKHRTKGLKEYETAVAKYQEAEPVSEQKT